MPSARISLPNPAARASANPLDQPVVEGPFEPPGDQDLTVLDLDRHLPDLGGAKGRSGQEQQCPKNHECVAAERKLGRLRWRATVRPS